MKKLLSIIETLNLSIGATVSTISCSLFGANKIDDNETEDAADDDLNISQTEEKAIESAVKSVDNTLALSKLEGGINANNSLTTDSTFNDAIEFLQEEVQEIDSNVSVESNADDKLNDNLIIGNNTISVKFKKNSDDEGQTINALITNVHNQEPRSSSIFESLIKSIFENGVRGKHLSIANTYEDVLSIINGKLDDIDDEIKISLVDKHPNEKLKGGNNKIKIKFVDKDNNEFIFPIDLEDVQDTGYIGKIREKYSDSAIFQIADHVADAFGTQKLEKIYNLSGLGLLKQAVSTIKSTGHHKINKEKYKEEYGNDPEEDINKSREDAKKEKRTTGFLYKIKNKLKFKKSKSIFESNEIYSANSDENSNTFEIPAIDTNDNTSETLKVKIQMKSVEETDKETQSLIKTILSSPINGKSLNTNEKMTALIPLIHSKMNAISGLHQWHIEFKDKKKCNKKFKWKK